MQPLNLTDMPDLKGKLVLQAWYNGKWNIVDHSDNTDEGLKRLEARYYETEFKDLDMKVELFT